MIGGPVVTFAREATGSSHADRLVEVYVALSGDREAVFADYARVREAEAQLVIEPRPSRLLAPTVGAELTRWSYDNSGCSTRSV